MIFILSGNDDYRVKKRLKLIKDAFLQKVGDASTIKSFDMKTADVSKLREAVHGQGLFTGKSLTVIDGGLSGKVEKVKLVEGVVSDVPFQSDSSLVFVDIFSPELKQARMSKTAQSFKNNLLKKIPTKFRRQMVFDFWQMKPHEVKAWLQKQFSQRDVQVDDQALEVLTQHVGTDLWALEQAVHQLMSVGEPITQGVILQHIPGQTTADIFAFSDALSSGNPASLLKLFQKQIDSGASPEYVLAMMRRQVLILWQLKQMEGLLESEIARQLKLHPFVVKKTLPRVRQMSADHIKNLTRRLYEIDKGLKQGKGELADLIVWGMFGEPELS